MNFGWGPVIGGVLGALLAGAFTLLGQRFARHRQLEDHKHARQLHKESLLHSAVVQHEDRLFTLRKEAGERFIKAAMGVMPISEYALALAGMYERWDDDDVEPGVAMLRISRADWAPPVDLRAAIPKADRLTDLVAAGALLTPAQLQNLTETARQIILAAYDVTDTRPYIDEGADPTTFVAGRIQEYIKLVDGFAEQLAEQLDARDRVQVALG